MRETKPTFQHIILILLGLILFSCNQKDKSKSLAYEDKVSEITIDLRKNRDIALSDFADEVKYIKLETKKENVFRTIDKLVINKEGIFIFDLDSTGLVFHFSLEGKFLNAIGKVGDGSEEYIQPRDFFVDEITNTIDIVDGHTSAIIKYNFAGDFVQRIEYGEKMLDRVQRLQNGNYFVKFSTGLLVGENQFGILDSDLNIVNEFLPTDYPFGEAAELIFKDTLNNSILFTYGYGDTIYQYKNDSVREKFLVNYGDARIPDEKRKQGGREMYPYLFNQELYYAPYGRGLIETQTHLFYTVSSRDENYICCYNKQKNASALYLNIEGEKGEVYSGNPLALHNENLLFLVDASEVSQALNKEDLSLSEIQSYGVFSSFEEVQKMTYAGDNPILVLMKPKSDL